MTALAADHLGIQVPELGIPVRMGGPLAGFLVQLAALARGMEQLRDQMGTDVVPEGLQLTGRAAGAPPGPPHGRLGSAGGGGLDERLEAHKQLWVFRTVGVRPPPDRRMRPGSSRSPDRTSLSPREILEREKPVVRATRTILPWPKERASVAAQYRRDLSVSSGAWDAYLARTTASSTAETETVPGHIAHLFSISPLAPPSPRKKVRT